MKDAPLTELKKFEKEDKGFSEVVYNEKDGYAVCAWNDNKRVIVASNFVGASPFQNVTRFNKKKKVYEEVQQPEMIRAYNTFMGGVDLADMLASMHTCPFRFHKWFFRIFERMIDTTLVNAWLLYRSRVYQDGDYMTLYEFRRLAAVSLLAGALPNEELPDVEEEMTQTVRRKYSHVQPADVPLNVRYKNSAHMPLYCEAARGMQGVKRPCAVRCKLKGCKATTYWFCQECKVYLCLQKDRNCFATFHS